MDTADRTTNSAHSVMSDGHDVPSSSSDDVAARAAALQQRVRELHDCIQDYRAQKKAQRPASAKIADTRPTSATDIELNDLDNQSRVIANQDTDQRPAAGPTPHKLPLRRTSAVPPPLRNRFAPVPQTAEQFNFVPAARHDQQTTEESRQYPPGIDPSNAKSAVELPSTSAIARITNGPTVPGKKLLRETPVWLISAAIHAVLLITLALLTFHQLRPVPILTIAGDRAIRETPPERDDSVLITTAPDIEPAEPTLSQPILEPTLLNVDLANQLAAPDLSLDTSFGSILSEQLSATRIVSGSKSSLRSSTGGAQFYGIQAAGDRFVFIVDNSGSMVPKFEDVKRELENAVRGLSKNQLFYVIFFNSRTERLRLGKWVGRKKKFVMKSLPEPALVPATKENKDAFVYWMNTIVPASQTEPCSAVAFTLRKLEPDAIFLLSDGEFTDGYATEELLAEENVAEELTVGVRPKTIVHCVGFYSRHGERTLKRIAKTYGGTYRFIEPPPGLLPAGLRFFGSHLPVH